MNVLKLNEDILISQYVDDKITFKNVSTFYQLAKLNKLTSLAELTFSYIERCFSIVAETQNFLEIEFNFIGKILKSSELSVRSELEVLNAATSWLKHNSNERSKFAKQLLLTVRLPLLSDHALDYILNSVPAYNENIECVDILKQISNDKETCFQNKSSNHYTSRYCNQNKFNILICGGKNYVYETVSGVFQIDGTDLRNVKAVSLMLKKRYDSQAVCLKGKVYVFGGYAGNIPITSFEKYSPSTNTWNKVTDMYDDRENFSACAFMDKIFIIGGWYYADEERTTTNSCLQFDTKDNNWKEVAGMNEARRCAACTIFEGRIVVSGGWDENYNELNTIESYDVIADEWSSMPNMTSGKALHGLVVVRNKLFVIGNGRDACEMFDKTCKKFVAIKSPPTEIVDLNKAISLGSKILVFRDNETIVLCYDVETNEWSEDTCEVAENLEEYACVKLPWN